MLYLAVIKSILVHSLFIDMFNFPIKFFFLSHGALGTVNSVEINIGLCYIFNSITSNHYYLRQELVEFCKQQLQIFLLFASHEYSQEWFYYLQKFKKRSSLYELQTLLALKKRCLFMIRKYSQFIIFIRCLQFGIICSLLKIFNYSIKKLKQYSETQLPNQTAK